jgi:hypothetical protein
MRKAGLLTICCVALAVTAAPADAVTTRAEYAAQVNEICVAGNKELKERLGKIPSTSKTPGGTKDHLTKRQQRRLLNGISRSLTRLLLRLTRHSGRVITRVVAVPPAPGDDALVSQWLTSIKRAQRLSKRANRLVVRFFRTFIEVFLVLEDRIEPDGSIDESKPTKRERRLGHRFLRITNALDRHSGKLLDEASRSSELALQLGATKCGGETDPNASAARLVESVARMAQDQVPAARALAKGG